MYKPDSKVLDELYTEKYKSVRLLIEAAPDMLRALEESLPLFEQLCNEAGGCDHDVGICTCDERYALESMREAIAKARPKDDADAEETKQDMEAP